MSLSICRITKMYCHNKVIRGDCLLGVKVINYSLIYSLESKGSVLTLGLRGLQPVQADLGCEKHNSLC